MRQMRLFAAMVVVLPSLLTLGASRASAEPIVFQFTSDHCTGGCGTAPFGTVTLTQHEANVDVVVALSSGYGFVKTGAGDNQAFKFNGIDVVLGDITVDSHVPALAKATGDFSGDGGGMFHFGINCPACVGGGAGAFANPIYFHVANATIADLTQPNNLNQIFVADVIAPGTGNTGLVDVSGTSVPDGGMTLMLMGGALVGLEVLRRRSRI